MTRVGGWGEAWGGGPWRAGKGGDGGGHQKPVWEQQKRCTGSPFLASLKNLTTGAGAKAWGGVAQGGDGGTRKLVTVGRRE